MGRTKRNGAHEMASAIDSQALGLSQPTRTMSESQILIGWAERDVTPTKPVALSGQFYKRVSQYVRDALSVTALALETKDKNGVAEQAIMATCDLVRVPKEIQDALRLMIATRIPDFDPSKLVVGATHTHSAPDTSGFLSFWDTDEGEGMMTWSQYREFLLDRLADTVVESWNNRKPGGISSRLGHAVVGHPRRTIYDNGTAIMYGPVHTDHFAGMEGTPDHTVDMLFCWDQNNHLTGIVINVPCPSQITEACYFVSADYWAEVRTKLRKKYSNDLFMLPQCGPSGDMSPRDLPRQDHGEPDMWDEPGLVEVGRRIAGTVDTAYPLAKDNVKTKVVFRHSIKQLDLPVRKVSQDEYEQAVAMFNELEAKEPQYPQSPDRAYARFVADIKRNESRKETPPYDNKYSDFVIMQNNEAVIRRYESQDNEPTYSIELHVIRLGDVVFATNPFELFVEYGLRMRARSRTSQTFLIQLAGDYGGYLPTVEATQRGGYGGLIINGHVGPKGGKILVDETVSAIDAMWNEPYQPSEREQWLHQHLIKTP